MGHRVTSVPGPYTKDREIAVSGHRLQSLKRKKSSAITTTFSKLTFCEADSVIDPCSQAVLNLVGETNVEINNYSNVIIL